MSTTYKSTVNPILESSGARNVNYDSTNMVLPIKNRVLAGTPVRVTDNAGTTESYMYKSGKVSEAVTAGTAVKLYKDHSFGVGDVIYDAATAVNITAIDTSNETYDLVTVDAAVTFTLDEVIYSIESGDINALSGIGIVTADVVWEDDETPNAFAVTFNATLDSNRMPNYWGAAIETGNITSVPAIV